MLLLSQGKSRYKGVCVNGEKWTASVSVRGKPHYVGTFPDQELAAKARDMQLYLLLGEMAAPRLHFPEMIVRCPSDAATSLASVKSCRHHGHPHV